MTQQILSQSEPSLTRVALNFITTSLKESLGYPASLMGLIRAHPEIAVDLRDPDPCIALESVVEWQDLGASCTLEWRSRERGELLGWSEDGAGYRSSLIVREEYRHIVLKEVINGWTCNITDVDGFALSKSNLLKFSHTDEMVEADSKELIAEISLENLNRNLAHAGIRIIHKSDGQDYFSVRSWDERLFLENGDGSHHFAAAKYIASRLGVDYKLQADLHRYYINSSAVAFLRKDFEMFVILDTPSVAVGFHDAMQSFRATWYWHEMPRPYGHTRAILLPRSEKRSMRVAAALRKAGVLDLGELLSRLAARPFASLTGPRKSSGQA